MEGKVPRDSLTANKQTRRLNINASWALDLHEDSFHIAMAEIRNFEGHVNSLINGLEEKIDFLLPEELRVKEPKKKLLKDNEDDTGERSELEDPGDIFRCLVEEVKKEKRNVTHFSPLKAWVKAEGKYWIALCRVIAAANSKAKSEHEKDY